MAACPRCGQPASIWQRDIFSGVCRKCMGGTTPTSLGCGTLIVIAIIVAIFSRPGIRNLESDVSSLLQSVHELKQAVDSQTNEIKQLQKRIESIKPMPEAAAAPKKQ